MKRRQRTLIALAIGAWGLTTFDAMAQETSHFTNDVQGGFTTTAGRSGHFVDNGWNIGADLGYNFNTHLGALFQFDYNENGINSTTLGNLGYPGGDIHVWDFSLDPIFHFMPSGPVDFY